LKESLDIASNSQSLVLQQRNQLELAAEISTRARGISNLKDLVQSVCDLIGERFNLYHVSIFKYEELEKQLLLIAESGRKGEGNKPSEFAIPISENSIIANVARTQKAYLAEDIEKDPLYLAVSNFKDVKSEISLPIVAGGKLFGVIDFLSSSEKALTWDEVNVLQILVNHIGTEINNVYLNNVRERHLEELEALHGIASAGIEATSEDELILRATQVVGESLFPRNFGVLLIDYDSGLLQHHSSYAESDSKKQPAIPLGEGITGLVALSGQSMRLADVSEEPKYISIDSDARSELCVPIKIGTRVLGVLNIESSSVNAFNQEDENLLLTLGGQLAIGLEKIRLLNEARSRADELAKVLDQNEEVNRLKGEFIQNVSHEFRTPLAIVSGYTEILNSGEFGELPSEIQQPINIIAKRVQLLNKLVDDLTSTLEVQGREKNFEVLDLAELIETLLPKIVEEASSKQIAVESEIDNSISKILGEKIFLQKAIDNLVTNAIKFNSPNGKIIIRVSERDGIIYLEVEDTGIGIPKENIERIFERFYQVDGSPTRQYSGTGLGLALVREVAQLHDGEIAVFSKLGEGSRFVFKIPIYAGKVTSKTLGRSSD
jgi:signal transduction histidine kinase